MPHTVLPALLPFLAASAKQAREAGGLTLAHVAVHVRKRSGRSGVSESTVARFEYGRVWPENPDAMLDAYATALGRDDPREIWQDAFTAYAAPGSGKSATRPRRRSRTRAA